MNIQIDDASAETITIKLDHFLNEVSPIPLISQWLAQELHRSTDEYADSGRSPNFKRLRRLLNDFRKSQGQERNDNGLLLLHACIVIANEAEPPNSNPPSRFTLYKSKFKSSVLRFLRLDDEQERVRAAEKKQSLYNQNIGVYEKICKFLNECPILITENERSILLSVPCQGLKDDFTAEWNKEKTNNLAALHAAFAKPLAKRKRQYQLLTGLNLLLLAASVYIITDSLIYAHGAGFAPFGLWAASSAPVLPIVIATALIVCSIVLVIATLANIKPEWFRRQQKSSSNLNTSADLAHNAYQPLSQHAHQVEKVTEAAPKTYFTKLFSCGHKPSASPKSKALLLDV